MWWYIQRRYCIISTIFGFDYAQNCTEAAYVSLAKNSISKTPFDEHTKENEASGFKSISTAFVKLQFSLSKVR